MLKETEVRKMIPSSRKMETWTAAANEFLPKYDINTRKRIAGFFAQGGHESADFNLLRENMNYRWQTLRRVFPRYFKTDAAAKAAERKPEVIANIVYDDKNRVNKIGNIYPGDGWRFIGRGIFQLSGRTNYTNFGKSVGMSAEDAAAYCETERGAFESACWFWRVNNLNAFADTSNISGMSARVNGGRIGLSDRIRRWNRALSALERDVYTFESSIALQIEEKPVVISKEYRTLTIGSRGQDVAEVQRKLGIGADGIFGPMTKRNIQSWQRTNGFRADGVLYSIQHQKMMESQ